MHQPLAHALLSRRQLLFASLAGAATVALAACGGDDASGSATTGGAGVSSSDEPGSANPPTTAGAPTTDTELAFVDDRGETITFSTRPQRVVAWQAIVPALVDQG